MERPMALQRLYLPPTQSQNLSMFSWTTPNSVGGDVGAESDKMLGDVDHVLYVIEELGVGGEGICDRFLSREPLTGNDEQGARDRRDRGST
jgi:hypothetical protein